LAMWAGRQAGSAGRQAGRQADKAGMQSGRQAKGERDGNSGT
jgi:hypothetical protein